MAPLSLSFLLLRRRPPLRPSFPFRPLLDPNFSTSPSPPLPSPPTSNANPKPGGLSARLSFVFDQLDAIERDRSNARAARDDALLRIRSWRQDQQQQQHHQAEQEQEAAPGSGPPAEESMGEVLRREVELVHPWPEWIELMDRLARQNYFDTRRIDEDRVAQDASIDISGVKDEVGFDFSRDWITVRTACMNFGRDRFDILKSLSKKDIQVLVGHGCPSMDPKVVFSAKLLRKHVHLNEGDVCSSCSLRNSCGRGYILTHKEDEARTLDVMRVLLTFGFDHVNGTVENKPLMKMKSVKTVVRKILHEVVKLSSVPIDPSLPLPVIKKAPPKAKQPPPPPKKRVGRDDVEMKKGDWLCPKCDFMNFAKNTVCLQCDAKRPKRQLLPGEWECPRCNFLNYRRNMACFHCEHKRPPDEFMESHIQAKQSGQRTRLERGARLSGVSDAWNFDFDDNESDGADVAAFEFADPPKGGEDSSLDGMSHGGVGRVFEDDTDETRRSPRTHERGRCFSEHDERKETLHSPRTGFDDFDEEEDDIDSYELESNNHPTHGISRRNFSEFERTSDSENFDDLGRHSNSTRDTKNYISDSENDGCHNGSENDLVDAPKWQSSRVADSSRKVRGRAGTSSYRGTPFASDDDAELSSHSDEDQDAVFRPKGRKTGQQSLHRNGISLGRNFDTDDELLDSEFEGDEDLRSGRIKMRGVSDRRSDTFRNRNGAASSRSREYRLDNRNRRKSFGSDNDELSSRGSLSSSRSREYRLDNRNRRKSFGSDKDELSSRGSLGYDRGSRGDVYGGFRQNDRFQEFDHRQSGRTKRFNDKLKGPCRNDRGSRGADYGGRREDNGFRSFNKSSGRERYDFRQSQGRNQYTD